MSCTEIVLNLYLILCCMFLQTHWFSSFTYNWQNKTKVGKVSNYFENMSNDLKQKLDRLPIMERLELLFHFKDNVNESFNRGKEPLQSFNLLRQLRNFLIHYKPFTEVVFSSIDEIQAEETKLEKMLKGKFEFNHDESAFVYKCITQDCAKWAFELIDDFYDWYCEELEIPRHNLKKHWEIK